MAHHNRWLNWKMKQGLAARGRTGGPLNPKGLIAGLLYKVYFKKKEVATEPTGKGRVFKQSVGGSLGASGSVNGE